MLQSPQICIRSGRYLGLCLALWAVVAIGPLTQVDIYGIVTSPWICHQSDNFGSWSGYLVISILWSDASVKNRPHASGYLDLLQDVTNLLLRWSASSRCYTGMMMCSIYIDESATRVDCCTTVTSSVYLFLKSWTVCLTVWITDTWCTVLKAAHLSGSVGVKSTPITIATWRFTRYKYPIRLAQITISHPIFLAFLGFFSLALC
jgi:hypothetical protein